MANTMRVAVCPCSAVLVPTFSFSKAEFYCLNDGRLFGLYDTETLEATPELEAIREANRLEFATLSEGLITHGARYTSCSLCAHGQDHDLHATQAQWDASQAARDRLFERRQVPAGATE